MDREKTSFATMGRTASGISIKFLGSGQSDVGSHAGNETSGSGSGLGRNLSLRAMGRDYGQNSGLINNASSGYNSANNSGLHSSSGGFSTSSGLMGTPVKQRQPSATVDQDEVNHQLNAVKLKLEERRRKIEDEKKKMEQLMVRQREKVGQEAFLRAVSRGIRRAESNSHSDIIEQESNVKQEILDLAHNVNKGNSAAISGSNGSDIAARKAAFSLRLGDSGGGIVRQNSTDQTTKTPDTEALDITRMSDSLQSLQSDIQRLALQQSQIQNIMNTTQRGMSAEPAGPPAAEQKSFFISGSNNNRGGSDKDTPSQQSFYMSAGGLDTSNNKPTANSSVRRTWGTPQPMMLAGQQQHGGGRAPEQYSHHGGSSEYNMQHGAVASEQYGAHGAVAQEQYGAHGAVAQEQYGAHGAVAPEQYGAVQADQFPVHHVPERLTLLNQYQQFHPQGQQQYSPYGQPLNGQSPAGGSGSNYHQPPQPQIQYGRPLSAPGTAASGPNYAANSSGGGTSYIIPASSSGYTVQYAAYPEPYATSIVPQTYEAPGTVRINLSRNNSFNRQQQLRPPPPQQQPVVVTTAAAGFYGEEPVYVEPSSAAAGPRPRSTSGFTQVEERGAKPPLLAEKPNLSYLQHRRSTPRVTGSPLAEVVPRPPQIENLYESVDHARTPSPGRGVEHYYETLDQQNLTTTPSRENMIEARSYHSYTSPTTSLTLLNRSGRQSLENAPITTSYPPTSQHREMLNTSGSNNSTVTGSQPEVLDQEMTSSTIETLNTMKTETIGDTSDAKGFVISFDNNSPVRPKPVLKPKKTSRRESLTSGISIDSNNSDSRRDGVSTPSSAAAKTPVTTPQFESAAAANFTGISPGISAGISSGICAGISGGKNSLGGGSSGNISNEFSNLGNTSLNNISNLGVEEDVRDDANTSERCVLCEVADIHQPILKLCSKCSNVLKANIHSPDALLRCSAVGDCDAQEYCPKCMLEKCKSLNMFDKITQAFQDSNPSTAGGGGATKADEKKLEWVQMMTLKRKQQAEQSRAKREEEARIRREEEEVKKAEQAKKKEEEKKRREEIFEQYKIKKELEKEEKAPSHPPPTSANRGGGGGLRMRPRSAGAGKPRPRTIHVDSDDLPDSGRGGGVRSAGLRGSHSNLNISSLNRSRNYRRGSNTSLHDEELYGGTSGMRGLGHIGRSKSSSVSNLGPGSLPLGLRRPAPGGGSQYGGHRGGDFDDGASDISSTTSGYRSGRMSARLYREPVSKSNRPIVMNAIEFVVFPGAVNRDTRMRVLEEIERCDCPHFLLLFRDNRLQFRALYAFYPDTEEVFKIYGNGPKQIVDNMIDNYYKYNSGGKKFTQIHTKHLTVTIDAFTIHNSLWLGKKTRLPDKRGLPLVI